MHDKCVKKQILQCPCKHSAVSRFLNQLPTCIQDFWFLLTLPSMLTSIAMFFQLRDESVLTELKLLIRTLIPQGQWEGLGAWALHKQNGGNLSEPTALQEVLQKCPLSALYQKKRTFEALGSVHLCWLSWSCEGQNWDRRGVHQARDIITKSIAPPTQQPEATSLSTAFGIRHREISYKIDLYKVWKRFQSLKKHKFYTNTFTHT